MFFRSYVTTRLVKPALIVSVATATTLTLLSDGVAAPSLSPSRFTPTTLIESADVTPNTKLLSLSIPRELLPSDRRAFLPIWSIFIKDSEIQVERPYTPLEGVDESGRLKLWVKRYENGEVGRWLHSRQVGDTIEIRGPVQAWSRLWQNTQWDEVIMISGGTGITPFYQLLHSVFITHDISFSNTRFTLLHGSRSSADLPPSSMVQSLAALSQKHPDRLQIQLFADSVNETSGSYSNIQRGRISKSVLQDALQLTHSTSWWHRFFRPFSSTQPTPEKKVLVLVCGPEGMVSAIAGPYGRNYSQGEVGGILRELGLQSHQVWKL